MTRSAHIRRFSVEGYKAFGRPASIDLGKLTLILGRNNAGKTALCLAPLFLVHALETGADTPFPLSYQGVDFGALQSVTFRRQPTGLVGTLELEDANDIKKVTIGATALPEQGFTHFITKLEILRTDGTSTTRTNKPWPEVHELLQQHSGLSEIPRGVQALRGIRPPPPRYHPYLGHVPDWVGSTGENAPMMLAASGKAGLDAVNQWFEPMRVRLRVERRGDAFEILASGTASEPVNLVDSGAGVAQVLPLIVALRLARTQPSLLCLEQPELHMHPRAHVAIAELLLESIQRLPSMRLLVETHSDTLVLRIRREIAARRLSPEDVKLYFVDEDAADGSSVREIELDDRGTPKWWPQDVFGEPNKEYFAIRRELARRDSSS